MYRFGRGSSALYFGLCILTTAFIQPSTALSATFGAGNMACTEWVLLTESGEGRGNVEEWLMGYLSGVSGSETLGETDPEELIAGVDFYCVTNPRHTLEQAARSLVLPPGIAIAGLGSSEGELIDQADMNEICRSSYPNYISGFYPVRWATTADYKEYSSSKGWNQDMVKIEESFALRAEDTLITSDRVAYDQATGAITNVGQAIFPGAVIASSSDARFRHKRFRAKPLCVWGRPDPALR